MPFSTLQQDQLDWTETEIFIHTAPLKGNTASQIFFLFDSVLNFSTEFLPNNHVI